MIVIDVIRTCSSCNVENLSKVTQINGVTNLLRAHIS